MQLFNQMMQGKNQAQQIETLKNIAKSRNINFDKMYNDVLSVVKRK